MSVARALAITAVTAITQAAHLGLAAPAARACDVALLLSIDVSGSIDRAEYRLQATGLADALDDPGVRDALLHGQVALGVVQWSGTGQQTLSLPWRRMLSMREIARFSARARAEACHAPISAPIRRWARRSPFPSTSSPPSPTARAR